MGRGGTDLMFVMLSAALDRPCQIPGPDALTRARRTCADTRQVECLANGDRQPSTGDAGGDQRD